MYTKKRLAGLLLLLTAFIWGLGFVVVKSSLDYVTPFYMIAARLLIGSAGMWIVFFKHIKNLNKQIVLHGSVLGVIVFVAFAFQTFGCNYTTAGKNSFLTAAYVVLIPFASWVYYRKKPSISSVLAGFTCLIGIGFLCLNRDLTLAIGDLLTLVCAVCYSVHFILVDDYTQKGSSALLLNMVQLTVGGLLATVFALVFEKPPTVITSSMVGSILFLGIFSTLLCFLFQIIAQQHISPSLASMILCLESVFGCVFSIIFLSEEVTIRLVIGCVLIFSAIIYSSRGGS